MMFIKNKEEGQVGAQGQRLNEPNSGVPIKKRPLLVTNRFSLEANVPSSDSLTPKHFTPKSPLDLSPSGFHAANPCSSCSDKPVGVATNPSQDFAIGIGRNYFPLKPTGSTNFMKEERFNQCSTDLSLTGPSTVSSKTYSDPSHNLLNNLEERSVFDLNMPTSETWESSMDDFTVENNGIAPTEPFEALAKQGMVSGMIPHGVVTGLVPNGAVTGLSPNGTGTGLMLHNMDKPSEKCEVTLDLQLKLPPRPELRMKNFEHDCSSDLRLSLSGKDLNSSAEPVNVKAQLVESSQKSEEKDITNPNVKVVENSQKSKEKDVNPNAKPADNPQNSKEKDVTSLNLKPVENSQKSKGKDITNPSEKPTAQNQVIVKQELHEVTLPEKAVQASGLKYQSSTSGRVVNSVVKKERVDTSQPQQSLGKLSDKLPCSGSESGPAKQSETSNISSPKGIDLNSATLLPEASTCSKMVNPVVAASVVAGQIVQSTIPQSDSCHNSENIDTIKELSMNNSSCSIPTSSPLAGTTEDIKPVITSSPTPALVVHNGKRMVPMVSDGLSQGSADMDCSEEGQILPKSTDTGKNTENANTETNALSSVSVVKTPKQEPGTISESKNGGIREATEGENLKNAVSSSAPTSKENQNQIPMPAEGNSGQNNENDIPSSSTNPINLPNQNMQDGLSSDTEMGGSKSRSSSSSMSGSDEEVDLPLSEKEDGTSRRHFEGNHFFRGRFKRTGLGPDRAQFQRKNPRMSHWDGGSNTYWRRDQRWEGHRFSKFDGDRTENEDNLGRRGGFNMANGKRQNNRFNSRFGHKKSRGFRFTRTNSNSDRNFDEGNDGRRRLSAEMSRPPTRFQNRRRVADVSPREADELDAPVFEHPKNHYRRADHTMIHRERSLSPGQRRGPYQWAPQGGMISGHTDMLTRVDSRVRSPGRRPFYKKDNMNRRHLSPSYNRVRKTGRDMHWNNARQRSDMGGPQGAAADGQNSEAYELRFNGGETMQFQARYPDNNVGSYSDVNRLREVTDQDEYRYNNRSPHGWRDGNPNNNGDKLKRRRY